MGLFAARMAVAATSVMTHICAIFFISSSLSFVFVLSCNLYYEFHARMDEAFAVFSEFSEGEGTCHTAEQLHSSVIPRCLSPRNLSFLSRAQTVERFLGKRHFGMTEIIREDQVA